jgi:hydroxymethylbilane synthase
LGGIISLDGQQMAQISLEGPSDQALKLGEELGQNVLGSGGAKILKEIKSHLNN